jgi:hypothetical protein
MVKPCSTALETEMTEVEFLQSFARNLDGSWRAIKPVQIGGVGMGPGVAFGHGVSMGGVNVAATLDQLAAKYPWAVQT